MNNRIIKFRAWDKEKKTMHDVVLINWQNHFVNLKGWVELDEFDEMHHGTEWKNLELMQYIGLKDKNGKEIYEGDIVKMYLRKNRLRVDWIGAGFWLVDVVHNQKDTEPTFNIAQNLEVLGNIFENPELLPAPPKA